MTAWRNFDELLDNQAAPHLDNPPAAGPVIFMHDGAMYVAHCEYKGPAAVRSCASFGLAKQKFWFKSDRKTCSASSNDNQTMPTPSSVMWRLYALRFTGCGRTWPEHQPTTQHIAVVAMLVIFWLPKETSSDTDVSFSTLKDFCIKCCHEFAWSET